MRTKFIVTNVTRLKAKYGTKYSKVENAINTLISADAARGITTTVWDVSSAAQMKTAGGKKVSKASDPRQNKDAVDAIYGHGQPDYILLLGSVDVIPHQDLDNPMSDEDATAWGDLPYACEQAYSRDVNDFLAPTRVIGRVPDMTGAKNPKHLVKLLDVAATWVPLAPKHYDEYFALSAEIWQKSTKLSIKRIFGSNKKMFTSPGSGPKWPGDELKPLPHFINCHGASGRMSFYGEDIAKTDQPEAHRTTLVRNNIERGTVAAVECCYGAELYKPGTSTSDKEHGICQEYMHDDAYAFFGSTTISYGPAEEMGQADIICAAFLQHVREGDSTGLAALKARQDFIKEATKFELDDQKTLAQFNLLGDPSIHPVQQGSKATKKTVAKPKGALGLKSAVSVAKAQPTLDNRHRARRNRLAKRGPQIAAQTIVARKTAADPGAAARARAAAGPYATKVVAAEVVPPAVMPVSKAKAKIVNESVGNASARTYFVKVDPPRTAATPSKATSKSAAKPPKLLTYSVRVVEEQPDGEMRVVREVFPK
jgi:hypothetical protein